MATLLDEFLIRVNAETRGAEEGLERTEQKADRAGASFASMAAKAAGALTAILGVSKTISGAIARASDVHLMNQTAESIGVAVEEMDAFRRVVEDTGGTAQGAETTLVRMAEAVGQALTKTNSEQAKTFQALGISLIDAEGKALDANAAMLEVAGAIEDMDQAQARFALKSLQITDPKTVELLLKGRQEIEASTRAHKEQGVVTREMAIQAGKLDTAMNSLRGGMDRASLGIMDALLPAIIKGVEWLTRLVNWANENKHFVVGFFGAIAAVVAAVYLPAMIAAAAATLAATWPLIAIGALVVAAAAAFALLYDDIMNFVAGNDSFIGQIFDQYPQIESIVFGLMDVFRQAWEGIQAFAQGVGEALSPLLDVFGDLFASMGAAFGPFLSVMRDAIGALVGMIGGDAAGAFNLFGTIVSGVMNGIVAAIKFAVSIISAQIRAVTAVIDGVSGAVGKVAGWLGFGGDDTGVAQAGQQLSAASASPMNATTSAAISNAAPGGSETNVPIGQVVINTSSSTMTGTGQDLGNSLEGQLRDLDAQTATGVAR